MGRGNKVRSRHQGHMTKMAATPICGENIQTLLQNQWPYFHETWYVALGTQAHRSLFQL